MPSCPPGHDNAHQWFVTMICKFPGLGHHIHPIYSVYQHGVVANLITAFSVATLADFISQLMMLISSVLMGVELHTGKKIMVRTMVSI